MFEKGKQAAKKTASKQLKEPPFQKVGTLHNTFSSAQFPSTELSL